MVYLLVVSCSSRVSLLRSCQAAKLHSVSSRTKGMISLRKRLCHGTMLAKGGYFQVRCVFSLPAWSSSFPKPGKCDKSGLGSPCLYSHPRKSGRSMDVPNTHSYAYLLHRGRPWQISSSRPPEPSVVYGHSA
jgi:hypothetical protein